MKSTLGIKFPPGMKEMYQAKIQNARAQPLFCSLNLLFGVALVAVAVAVVVC